MKFAYRMYREAGSPVIKQSPIYPVPDTMESCRSVCDGYVSMEQVFDNKKDAKKSWDIDKRIVDYSTLSDEECLNKLIAARDKAKAAGFGSKALEAAGFPSRSSLNQYIYNREGSHVDARMVVRAELITEHLQRAIKEARETILPGRGMGKYRHKE